MLRKFVKWVALTLCCSAAAFADVNGAAITDMHYSIFDSNQTTAICFQAGGVALAFISNGSDKDRTIIGLLVAAFSTGKTISVQTSAVMSPSPCQSWEFPSTVFQAVSISFQP